MKYSEIIKYELGLLLNLGNASNYKPWKINCKGVKIIPNLCSKIKASNQYGMNGGHGKQLFANTFTFKGILEDQCSKGFRQES